MVYKSVVISPGQTYVPGERSARGFKRRPGLVRPEALSGRADNGSGVTTVKHARPFLKWAGGKTQLLPALLARIPPGLEDGSIQRYVEPFVGSGALFFDLAARYPALDCRLFDANPEVALVYRVVRERVEDLVARLCALDAAHREADEAGRRALYYLVRDRFNAGGADPVERAADLLFLNRTGFNGLYRTNASGGFNVPHGRYRNPRICRPELLRAASRALADAGIEAGDFSAAGAVVDDRTFVYLDPPYRPLSKTASFTAYSQHRFGDEEQRRLAAFARTLDARGARFMLSNSDPRNADPGDDFFDALYEGFVIERVPARRAINRDGAGRGTINELIVRNYAGA